MTLVKRIDMALHVQELCDKNSITVSYVPLDDRRPFYCANRVRNSITIRPTKNTGYYVSALHEIGHLIGPNQSSRNDRFEMEVGAWKYAMATAIVWTDTATRVMKKALMSYGVTDSQWQGVWSDCLDYCNAIKEQSKPFKKEIA